MTPKYVRVLIPGTCKYINEYYMAKGSKFVDAIKIGNQLNLR
jgi:hypothetical protein